MTKVTEMSKEYLLDRLYESEYLLLQICVRSYTWDKNINFVKMPLSLRDEVDEYLKKYPKIEVENH